MLRLTRQQARSRSASWRSSINHAITHIQIYQSHDDTSAYIPRVYGVPRYVVTVECLCPVVWTPDSILQQQQRDEGKGNSERKERHGLRKLVLSEGCMIESASSSLPRSLQHLVVSTSIMDMCAKQGAIACSSLATLVVGKEYYAMYGNVNDPIYPGLMTSHEILLDMAYFEGLDNNKLTINPVRWLRAYEWKHIPSIIELLHRQRYEARSTNLPQDFFTKAIALSAADHHEILRIVEIMDRCNIVKEKQLMDTIQQFCPSLNPPILTSILQIVAKRLGSSIRSFKQVRGHPLNNFCETYIQLLEQPYTPGVTTIAAYILHLYYSSNNISKSSNHERIRNACFFHLCSHSARNCNRALLQCFLDTFIEDGIRTISDPHKQCLMTWRHLRKASQNLKIIPDLQSSCDIQRDHNNAATLFEHDVGRRPLRDLRSNHVAEFVAI